MANRTIQFLGQGYADGGTEPITLTATLDGNTVFSGTIPTLYTGDINRQPGDQVVLFTCEVPMDYAGTKSMTIDLDNPVGVCAFFEQIRSNYMPVFSEVANTAPTSSGPDTFLSINSTGIDPRSNVVINGVAEQSSPPPNGAWGWEVEFPAEDAGTFTCDLAFTAGLE